MAFFSSPQEAEDFRSNLLSAVRDGVKTGEVTPFQALDIRHKSRDQQWLAGVRDDMHGYLTDVDATMSTPASAIDWKSVLATLLPILLKLLFGV